jgi:hypothetical protein
MNANDFNEVVERRKNLISQVLQKKAGEYAIDGDRMYNFKRAALITNQSPEQVLLGMWTKHIVSVIDIIEAIKVTHNTDSEKYYSQEYVDEKLGDLINYAILLEGLLTERYNYINNKEVSKDI